MTDRLLGAGAFGRVFMAVEQSTRSQLACKVVDLRKLYPKTRIGRHEYPAAAEDVDNRVQLRKVKDLATERKRDNKLDEKLRVYHREIDILASISHVSCPSSSSSVLTIGQPNIIGLEKVYMTENTMYARGLDLHRFANGRRYIFQDLVTAGDLFSYIESKSGKLLEVEAAVIVRQIVIALCFLHERNIVHRDLKPDNILMTHTSSGCRVILTDFGAARRIANHRQRMKSLVGTNEYAAPEVGRNISIPHSKPRTGYCMAVDMWSLGCVTVILLTGGSPFIDPRTNNYSEELAGKCDLEYLSKSKDWEQVRSRPKDFVAKLLCLDEAARMTAQQALDHDWFSNDFHRANFEDLYERTIKNWRPRLARNDIIQSHRSDGSRYLSQLELPFSNKRSKHTTPRPVESTMKPVPRGFLLNFWPKKKPTSSLRSKEVQEAIEEHWTFTSDDDCFSNNDMTYLPVSQRNPSNLAGRSKPFGGSGSASLTVKTRGSSELPHDGRASVGKNNADPSIWMAMPKPAQLTTQPNHAMKKTSHSVSWEAPDRKATNAFNQNPIMPLRPANPASTENIDPIKPKLSTSSGPAPLQIQKNGTTNDSNSETVAGDLQAPTNLQLKVNPEAVAQISQNGEENVIHDGISEQTEAAQLAEAISTPLKLKRLQLSSRLGSRGSSPHSPNSKRRRQSIFDIEEDDETEMKGQSGIIADSCTRATSLNEEYFQRDFDENEPAGIEITMPHSASRLSELRRDGPSKMLHLPR